MELGLPVFCSVLNLLAVAVPLFFPGSTGFSISPTPAISHSEGPFHDFPHPSNAHSPTPQPSVLLPPPAPPPIISAGPVTQPIKGIAPSSQSPVTKSGAPPPSRAPPLQSPVTKSGAPPPKGAPPSESPVTKSGAPPPSGAPPSHSPVTKSGAPPPSGAPPSESPVTKSGASPPSPLQPPVTKSGAPPPSGAPPSESPVTKSGAPPPSPLQPPVTKSGAPPPSRAPSSQSPVAKSGAPPPSSAPPLAPSAPEKERQKPEIPPSGPLSPVSVVSPPSKSPQKAPKIFPKQGSAPKNSERNKTPDVNGPIYSPVAPAPKETVQDSPPIRQPVAPRVQPFISPAPVAPPPRQVLRNSSSAHPRIPKEPPSVLPAPSPSINQSRTATPIPAPPNEATSKKNTSSHTNNAPPPLSSPKSPPSIEFQSPPSSLPTSVYRHRHGKENITRPAPLPFSPPAPAQQGPIISPAPSSHPKSGHKQNGSPFPGFPPAPPLPSPRSPLSHHPSASAPPPSRQNTFPSHSPKSSPAPPPSIPKVPVLPRIRSLPPPPPNQDCEALNCVEPFTNRPPGSPCGCVCPLQVELRLSVALYTFFPLVAEFAEEIAAGVFMKQSQIRIMGANADSQDPEKTTVLVDLVPLGDKFDNTTAYFTFQRFWLKQVPINTSLFGSYEVVYVRYPGLPPSPPSSINVVDGQPYSDNGNNGRTIQPLGVDVRKGQHKNRLSGGIIAIIVLSASATVFLCCAIAWVLLFKRGHDQPEPSTTATVPSLSKPSGIAGSIFGDGPSSASLSFASSMATYTGSAKTFSSSEIQRATDSFNASNIIGEGGFGRVYSGVLEDGTEVAVKVLKRDDQHGSREFLAEVEMLSRLHHRNLVKLIGICTEERSRCLVYELIRNGSLESHLHGIEKETNSLDWGTRLKIALGAARGLAYLHEDSSPRVIHRDFKSSNILLEHDFTPKVSDFGLARTALDEENRHVSTRVMGTFGYVAPEYAMTGHLLVKSDVYSYGVVLLELLTGRKPVDMSQPPGEENLVAWARPQLTSREALESIIDPSIGPDFPFDSIAKVAAIASMCVQPEVSHRPFMGEVVQALKLVVSDDEGDGARELGSRCCSLEDLSVEMNDDGTNTNSDQMAYRMQNHSPLSDYDAAERGLSMSDFFEAATVGRADSGSFRMHHSSSGPPLRSGKGKQLWQKMRRLSH